MKPELDEMDLILIEKSRDLEVSRRRTKIVLLFGVIVLAGMFIAHAFEGTSEIIFWVSVVYVAITTLDKASYGFAVRAYKKVVFKLAIAQGLIEEEGKQST